MATPEYVARTRGSESSRALQQRLKVKRAGRGFSPWSVNNAKSAHVLEEFFREQQTRIHRQLDRSVNRVRQARLAIHLENERATRHEAIIGFDIEVRGSCGSDVHGGDGGEA
jgi:hypothetical protein